MRFTSLLPLLFTAVPALAQNWYVPDSNPTTGTCNVIPFGQSPGGSFYQCKYQQRCTVADLGAAVGVVTGLGFASCAAGRAHYDSLEIVLDHIPAAQPLSTTFASNLTANAVTVLLSTNYTWNVPANLWYEVGLQQPFVYNGIDDLVIQITTVNGTAPVNGMHRDVRQRIYWIAAAGTPPAVGTSGFAALKIEVSMMTAHTSSHGDGCSGSNGTPALSFVGSSQIGQTLSINLNNGVPNSFSLFLAGTTNAFPFPLELGFLGMPSCYAYTDLLVSSVIANDAVGAGSFTLAIPPTAFPGFLFYSQFACLDPAANAFGFTTSNYGRVFVGN